MTYEEKGTIVDNSQIKDAGDLFLCSCTVPSPNKLKETNTDFISDENLQKLKEKHFITDKDKISMTDLLMWLPADLQWMCEPIPQKCSYSLQMTMNYDIYDDETDCYKKYAFFYGNPEKHYDIHTDYMLMFMDDKKNPALFLSNNPLEAVLNLVYWVLENCVCSYSYQAWFRGWYAQDKWGQYSEESVDALKHMMSHVEPDNYNSNKYFPNLGFTIKKDCGEPGCGSWVGQKE